MIKNIARVPGVEIVRLKIYKAPSATSLVLAVVRPAYFLRHQLKPILTHLGDPVYVRVVDGKKRAVLEWYSAVARGKSPSGGSLYVRHGLEGCSPIVALGWFEVKPCPVK